MDKTIYYDLQVAMQMSSPDHCVYSTVVQTDVSLYGLLLFVKVAHMCPTLCDPINYTVHGILQARMLEWVDFPFSKGIFPTQGQNPGFP